MKRLRITVLDLVAKGPAKRTFQRLMNANMASIMPQAVAAWCEELGHQVRYICYTGYEDLGAELKDDTDVLIVGAFSRAALTAYAISNLYRGRGAVTVLGGPHARCYPEDAAKYFDYVLGFTDKQTLIDIFADLAPHRPVGRTLSADRQPPSLPSLRQRWKYVAANLAKAPLVKIAPMIGSMGCPYTCSFCIDSVVPYQPLEFAQIRDDLKFLASKVRRPIVAWHDPNFGVRFNDYMAAIEDAVPPGGMRFIAESSLSLLSEPHLKRLKRNGFVSVLPGVESWYDLGNKSKTGAAVGLEKVRQVADHVNLIMRYIPHIQTNFVLGLDSDRGAEPFELTKRFIDLAPGAYPAFSLLTCYGAAAPLNLEFQRAGRVLPFPFHFLDGNHAMNVKPLNYEWGEFYERAADLALYAHAPARMYRRWRANSGIPTRMLNLIRSTSSRRGKYQSNIRARIEVDPQMRDFFAGTSDALPDFYRNKIRRHLGALWDSLPEGALMHDPQAYLKRMPANANLPAVAAAE
jgi:hypothetical protein